MKNTGIGGYFELELRKGEAYHAHAIAMNSARHCLEYILKARGYKKIYIPYFTCGAVLEPIERMRISHERYAINELLEPRYLPELRPDESFLYTNYFGLKQKAVEVLAAKYGSQLIVDNAQAFFAPALPRVDTFYSPRKFFGVPDGGYLYTEITNIPIPERDVSWHKMQHLLQRWEEGAQSGYSAFLENESGFSTSAMRTMSQITDAILRSVDYEHVKCKRRLNFEQIHRQLGIINKLQIDFAEDDAPMVYPLWTSDTSLRQRLIENKIFVATYWPEIANSNTSPILEKELANNLVPLPIDQRYELHDLLRILEVTSMP